MVVNAGTQNWLIIKSYNGPRYYMGHLLYLLDSSEIILKEELGKNVRVRIWIDCAKRCLPVSWTQCILYVHEHNVFVIICARSAQNSPHCHFRMDERGTHGAPLVPRKPVEVTMVEQEVFRF